MFRRFAAASRNSARKKAAMNLASFAKRRQRRSAPRTRKNTWSYAPRVVLNAVKQSVPLRRERRTWRRLCAKSLIQAVLKILRIAYATYVSLFGVGRFASPHLTQLWAHNSKYFSSSLVLIASAAFWQSSLGSLQPSSLQSFEMRRQTS